MKSQHPHVNWYVSMVRTSTISQTSASLRTQQTLVQAQAKKLGLHPAKP